MLSHRTARLFVLVCFIVLVRPVSAVDIQVEGPQDSLAGAPSINHCTLRKAVINSNTNSGPYPQCQNGSGIDRIEFYAPSTMVVTFALAGAGEEAGLTGDLDVTDSLIIDGNGATVDGNALDRVFHVHPGVTLTINNLWIRNGSGNDGGGGILVDGGTLNLNNVTISGSSTPSLDGGAILVRNGGILNMRNCTITGNSAPTGHAGAILIESSTATITNSTITGNSSGFASLTGGIRNSGGTVTLRNTIVAGNGGTDIPNLDGVFVSTGFNVIGTLGTSGTNPTIGGAPSDQTNVATASLHLGPLQNNGGPTPTMALLTGSVALDKGHASGSTTDQRGLTRPCEDATIANATGGDGGDVGAYEEQVACSNTPPDAVDDSATVAEDSGANAINVLVNDSDANAADTLTIIGATQGTHGSVAITGGGTGVTYTPNANYFGADTFTYTVDDGHTSTDTATVTVAVTNVQDAPDAVDDSATVAEDSGANSINVRANDTDLDGDTLTVSAVTQGTNGSVTNGGTSVSYQPAHDFFGTDTFTYTISDGNGGSDTATVTVNVTNVQDAPDASDDSATIAEDSGANSLNVLANDVDADGDALNVTGVTQGTHGSVANNGTSVAYQPAPDFFGSDTFTYTISDGHGGSDTATVTVNVTNVPDPPDAVNDGASIAEDSGSNTINVLANDTDADGDTLTITAVTQGTHGSVTNGGTSVAYMPAPDFFGTDTFTYTISDGHGFADTATVTVTVTNVNDAAVASEDTFNMNQDTTLNVAAPGVLANDTDVDGDTLHTVLISGVSHGLLTLNPNGSLVYAPFISFAGTDTFTYAANDGTVNSNIVTVTIRIADTQPPTLTASVGTSTLWSPNHSLVNVGLAVSATDNSTAVTTSMAVYSNENDGDDDGEGQFSPDAKNIAAGTLRLRAERSGRGNGRVYLIIVRAADAFANTSRSCLTVVVPKSQSASHINAVNVLASAARAQCQATGMAPAGYFVVGDGPIVGPKQ